MESLEHVNAFQERLRSVIAAAPVSKAELARAMGEKPQLINKWINSPMTRLPSATYIAKLHQVLGVNMLWLTTGEGSREYSAATEFDSLPGLVSVPEYKIVFRPDGSPEFEELLETVPRAYERSFFDLRRIHPADCRRVQAECDSMAPLIMRGDRVLIDCSATDIVNGAVYLIAYDRSVMLQRLLRQFSQLVVKSENPTYPDVVLSASDVDRVHILGRVISRDGALF